MSKLLIRAGISPLDSFSPEKIIANNSIGDNSGNLIYAYSIFRTLLTDSVEEIVPNYYRNRIEYIDYINGNYSHFVIPLADAFRKDFLPEMRNMTKLINKLKIPCTVVGCGLRAPQNIDINKPMEFDDDVRDFIKAVLQKSAIVGLRGDISASYLKRLGFVPEKDYTVIGCPSMYTNGPSLPIRPFTPTKDSKISINNNVMTPNGAQHFLAKIMEEYPNHYFVPQRINELRLIYMGERYVHQQNKPTYPITLDHPLYAEDRTKFFLRADAWINYLRGMDLSLGGRMHGNIASVIAGTPAIWLPHDARMKELIDYHELPSIPASKIKANDTLEDLLGKVDLQSPTRNHKKRFDHFIDFLNANGLDHIYKTQLQPSTIPLDQQITTSTTPGEAASIVNCSKEQVVERLQNYAEASRERFDDFYRYHRRVRSSTVALGIDLATPAKGMAHFTKKVLRHLQPPSEE